MGKKVQLMTQAAYAKHRGCSQVAVHKAVAAGRISLVGEMVDPVVADIQWARNTRARSPNASRAAGAAGDMAPSDVGDYAAARARREIAEAELSQIAAATARGDVVLRADVDRAFFEISRELRDGLDACTNRIAAEVAALPTAEDCAAVITREHRALLNQFVKSSKEKAKTPATEEAAE